MDCQGLASLSRAVADPSDLRIYSLVDNNERVGELRDILNLEARFDLIMRNIDPRLLMSCTGCTTIYDVHRDPHGYADMNISIGYIHESYGYEYNNFLVDNIRGYIHALEIS